MGEKIFASGSEWIRIDLHLHTKTDSKFKYNGDDFAKDYINALKKANIKIAGITNHNKFDLDEFLELKEEGGKEGIWFLPGIELEISEGKRGIHILIIFDPNDLKNDNGFINDFITRQFDLATKQPNKTLEQVLKDLQALQKNYILIFAHVDNDKGFLKELNPANYSNWIKRGYLRKEILALQDISNFSKNKFENELKKELKDKWEKHKPAYVSFIDPCSIDDIVEKDKKTYVKIGDFNFNALKFAFINHELRINSELKEERYPQILSLTIEDGNFIKEHTFNFNSSLNTLIGVRGSGKSSIIEVLRWIVGKEPLKDSDQDYKKSLVQHALGNGGKTILKIKNKDGFVYRIERNYTDFYPRVFDGDGNIIDIGKKINEIFDFVYYGQKDLSEISKSASNQLKLIDEFIEVKIRYLKNREKQKIDEIKELIKEIKRIESEQGEIEDLEGERSALKEKVKIFKQKGVDKLLNEQAEFEKEKEKFEFVISTIKEIEIGVRNLKEKSQSFEMILEYNFSILKDLKEKLSKLQDNYNKGLDNLINVFKAFYKSIDEEKQAIENKEKNLIEKLNNLKKEIDPELDVSFFIKTQKKLQQIEMQINKLKKREEILQSKNNQLEKVINELIEIQKEIYKKRIEFADKITKQIDFLKVNIEFRGDKEQFFAKLKELLQGTGIRKSKIEILANAFKDGHSIYKAIKNKEKSLIKAIGESDFYKLKEKFNDIPDKFIAITPPDKVIIEYKINETEFKPLKKLSIGQRAASILSIILLNQDKPVIIDQPEDDIDNSTIYQGIITTILSKKEENQFIFATHNSNIVVLGDSDNVFVCENEGDTLYVKNGSIDNLEIQNKIVSIMEGGKEAFERRKIIYQVWRDFK